MYLFNLLGILTLMYSSAIFAEDPFGGIEENQKSHGQGIDAAIHHVEDIFDAVKSKFYKNALLIALNKITTTRQELLVPILDVASFYNIQIEVLKCVQVPYEQGYELIDNQALIRVFEKNTVLSRQVFYGWISSNNLWTSNIAHSVYHIILKECK